MSLQPMPFPVLPESTARVARRAFRRGNLYLTFGDQIGTLWNDEDLKSLYALKGPPGLSPAQLVLVLIFQALENLSDRQAAEAVRARIDWKYALHLELEDEGFDFAVLSAFRDRLIEHQQGTAILDRLLERLRAMGLLKQERQRTDSTYVLQASRVLNRLELVIETMRGVLEDLAGAFPAWMGGIAQPSWLKRYAQGWQALRMPRDKKARQELAEEVGQDGRYLLGQIEAPEAPEGVRERPWVQRLVTVWAQQYEAETGRWRPGGSLPAGADLWQTPQDPEARYGEHGGEGWTGYALHLTETTDPQAPRLITQVTVTAATGADVSQLTPIQESLVERGLAPREHLADQGYVAAHTLQESQARGIDLLGRVAANTTWQAKVAQGFIPEQFMIDWPNQRARCPQGQWAHTWSLSHTEYHQPVVHIRFPAAVCAACPSRERCTRGQQGRSLKLSPDFPFLQEARARQETPPFKRVYAQRSGIEGTLSHATREHGARQCRYIGLWKTQLQELLVATAINIERATRWLEGKRPATTRVSHLARLALSAA
jgi:transposase